MIYSKRINGFLFGLLLLIAAAQPALAIDPPDIEAGGHLLMDVHTGNVLSEKNADERLEPASLTKIMTAHLVFMEIEAGRIKLDEAKDASLAFLDQLQLTPDDRGRHDRRRRAGIRGGGRGAGNAGRGPGRRGLAQAARPGAGPVLRRDCLTQSRSS